MLNISSNAAGALVVEQSHPQHQLLSVFRYGDTSIFDGILFAQGIVDKVHIKAFMRDYCILALQAAKIQEARTSLCLETLKEGRLKSTAESENKVGGIKALQKNLLV